LTPNGYLSFHLIQHNASALLGKIETHEIGVKMNKKRQKPSATLLTVT